MKLLLLVVMLVPCAAALDTVKDPIIDPVPRRDLNGQMFTFPNQESKDYVTLIPREGLEGLRDVTFCLRAFTDLTKGHPLLSLSTASRVDELKLCKLDALKYRLSRGNASVEFTMQDNKLNKWYSLCGSFAAGTGIGQIWIDGRQSNRKFVSQEVMKGPLLTHLGKNPSTGLSGGSFGGQMKDVYMWAKVLSPCEIQSFMKKGILPEKRLLDWDNMLYQVNGKVLLEDDQRECQP